VFLFLLRYCFKSVFVLVLVSVSETRLVSVNEGFRFRHS